jgi:hypothetical protein
MKLGMKYLTSTALIILFSVEGQAATFYNTIPVQLLNSAYYYDLSQSANLRDCLPRPCAVISTETEKMSDTTNQPFSETLTLEQASIYSAYPWAKSSYYSNASGSAFSLSVSSVSRQGSSDWVGSGYSFATGTWQFQALTNEALNYRLGGSSPWDDEFILLTDLTTNQIVYSIENIAFLKNYINNKFADQWKGAAETVNWNIYSNDLIMENALMSGHIYQLDMGVLAQSSNDGWSGSVSANLKAVPIPLPFWLFATGLGFISKRRFQKSELPV